MEKGRGRKGVKGEWRGENGRDRRRKEREGWRGEGREREEKGVREGEKM